MKGRIRIALCGPIAALGLLVGGTAAVAQTNAIATGNWSDPLTWSAGEPAAGVDANIDGSFTVTLNQAGEAAGTLDVGSIATQTGNLDIDAPGALTVGTLMRVGFSGTGVVDMTGGTVAVNGAFDSPIGNGELIVGDAGGNGTVNVSGGTFTMADEVFIGLGGGSVGAINVSGGSLSTAPGGRSIIVGFGGGNGTLDVSGTGDVDARFDMLVGFQAGSMATINLSGGTIDAGFLFTNFAGGAGSTVIMSQTGGTYTARIAYVLGHSGGTTTMTHSGGAINVPVGNGDMVVSDGGGNTSIYNISGTATVTLLHNFFVGAFGGSNGTVHQSGGTITAGDIIDVGRGGTGAWNLSGGTINAKHVFLGDFDNTNGTMKVTGGTINLSGNLNIGAALASNAPPAPVGTAGQALNADGTLIVSGSAGDINVTGNLLANDGDHTRALPGNPGDNVSTLVFEILNNTGVSRIDVAGIADLTGADIDVDILGGSFSLGATFDLITASSISNDFLQVPEDVGIFSLAIVSGGNGQILQATLIPEPASVVLLGLSVGGLASCRRRSKN